MLNEQTYKDKPWVFANDPGGMEIIEYCYILKTHLKIIETFP